MTPQELRERAARAKAARTSTVQITDSDALELAETIERLTARNETLQTELDFAHGDTDFQGRVRLWMLACFGPEITADRVERVQRFLEEALELAQALGGTAADAHALVDYVFGRPVGVPHQEVGGVLVTLAALCGAVDLDMDSAGEDELERVWGKIEVIREKQRTKPHGSPLPEMPGCYWPLPCLCGRCEARR